MSQSWLPKPSLWAFCLFPPLSRLWVSFRMRYLPVYHTTESVVANSSKTKHRSVIILVGLGFLATYTGITIGKFKQRHPHVQHFGDAGEVLLGAWGREILGTAQIILMVFAMASHLLTFTVAMNTITNHVVCSIVWGVIGMVISCILCLPRTLEKMSWLSLVCMSLSFLKSISLTRTN